MPDVRDRTVIHAGKGIGTRPFDMLDDVWSFPSGVKLPSMCRIGGLGSSEDSISRLQIARFDFAEILGCLVLVVGHPDDSCFA